MPEKPNLQACLHMLLGLPRDNQTSPRRIDLYRCALGQLRRERAPELWATLQYELADHLVASSGPGRARDIEDAIRAYQAALEVWTRQGAPEKWALVLHDLGAAFRLRVHGDRRQNLERAIQLYRAALQVRTRQERPDGWAVTQLCLGIAHKDLPGDDRETNHARALDHYRAVLEVWSRPANPNGWARVQHNLGNLYAGFPGGDWAANLEQAAEHYRQALEIRTRAADPAAWAMTQTAMGNLYVERIEGDRAENLEHAIELYEEALEVRTECADPPGWAETQYNLAVAYRKRIRGDPADNQEEAIRGYKQALRVHTRDAYPLEWASATTELGLVYYRRLRGDRAENLERAIALFQQALEVRRREGLPEEWATTQLCLANAYCDRVRGDRADNLERGIEHFNLALEARTPGAFPYEWAMLQNNLGTAYWERVRGPRVENLDRAVDCFSRALKVHTPDAFPIDARRAARNLGRLFFEAGRWPEAHAAYTQAIQAARHLYRAAFTEAGRAAEIGENALLYAHDAFCLAHTGRADPALMQQAVLQMEEGKTRTLAERMQRGAVQLQKASPEDRAGYLALANRLKALEARQQVRGEEGRPLDTPSAYRKLAEEVKTTRHKLEALVQRLSGELSDFAPAALDLAAIQALARDEGTALVELCVTERGSVALVIGPQGDPEAVEIEGFTRGDLHRLMWETPPWAEAWLERHRHRDKDPAGWQAALAELAAGQGEYQAGWQIAYQLQHITAPDQAPGEPDWQAAHQAARRAWLDTIERVLAEVGRQLLAPLHATLQDQRLSRLILVPQGSLFLLPLHAVPLAENEPLRLLDCYTISYTPSAAVLKLCRDRLQSARGRRLFAVTNPTGNIAYAGSELRRIGPLFGEDRVVLERDQATRQAVLEGASGHAYVYFSCHGQYNWHEPMRSALSLAAHASDLADGLLTLAEIEEKLDLSQTRLVSLSACETGLSEATGPLAEEYIGLPAGFLLAGAPGVLAPLWAVSEVSTALLMERFYVNHLCGDPDQDTAARSPLPADEALRRAQIWLRDRVTNRQIADRCEARIQELDRAQQDVPEWLEQASQAYDQRSKHTPDGRPFAHAYHWAAFALSGAGPLPEQGREEDHSA
jgi:CHAT domain-containing protein